MQEIIEAINNQVGYYYSNLAILLAASAALTRSRFATSFRRLRIYSAALINDCPCMQQARRASESAIPYYIPLLRYVNASQLSAQWHFTLVLFLLFSSLYYCSLNSFSCSFFCLDLFICILKFYAFCKSTGRCNNKLIAAAAAAACCCTSTCMILMACVLE